MNETRDFRSRIKSITRILEIGEYTNAATECVKLIEQALRHVVSRYLERVDDKVRRKVQEAVQKRDRRGEGIDRLTMGQLVHVLRESEFLDAWARVSGKDLRSLRIINLDKLTQLRNKVMHEGAEATRAEAELLFKALHVILDAFEFANLEEIEGSFSLETETVPQQESVASKMSHGRTVNVTKGNYFETIEGEVNFGPSIYGDHAQQLSGAVTPQASKKDFLELLAKIQQKLEQSDLPPTVKEEAEHEIKGAEIQVKKDPPNKEKVVEKLKNAEGALKGMASLGKETVVLGNLIGKAIEWVVEKWIEWTI